MKKEEFRMKKSFGALRANFYFCLLPSAFCLPR